MSNIFNNMDEALLEEIGYKFGKCLQILPLRVVSKYIQFILQVYVALHQGGFACTEDEC